MSSSSPSSSSSFFKGFNTNVWVLMLLELFERLAYYGCSFTLSTYTMYMLNVSMSTMNILTNLMYVLSPFAALIGGGMSDGRWGRKWVLLFGSIVYTLGLSAIAASAMPWEYEDFPYKPTTLASVTLIGGLAMMSVGYGCMKVCLAPLLADVALVGLGCCSHSTEGGKAGDDTNGEGSRDNANDGGFVPVTVKASSSSLAGGSASSCCGGVVDIATATHNGCQCGCQEGGVCHCNPYVREERERAYEHIIGNARQSLIGPSRRSEKKGRGGGDGVGASSRWRRTDDDDTDADTHNGDGDGAYSDYSGGYGSAGTNGTSVGRKSLGGGGSKSAVAAADDEDIHHSMPVLPAVEDQLPSASSSSNGLPSSTVVKAKGCCVVNTSIGSSSGGSNARSPALVSSSTVDEDAAESVRNSKTPLMIGGGEDGGRNTAAMGNGGGGGHSCCGGGTTSTSASASSTNDIEPNPDKDAASSLLSRLFRFDYFIINFGSIIGIAGAPFLRDADPRVKVIAEEGDDTGDAKEVHVGYYIGFWVCAAATLVGTFIYLARLRHMPINKPARTMLIFKVMWAAITGRLLFGRFQRGEAYGSDCDSYHYFASTSSTNHSTHAAILPSLSSDAQQQLASAFFDTCLSRNCQTYTEWKGPRFIMYAQFEGFLAEQGRLRAAAAEEAEDGSGDARVAAGGLSTAEAASQSADKSAAASAEASLIPPTSTAVTAAPQRQPTDVDYPVTTEEAKGFALTMALCASFSPLPVYWLLATQFSSNVVMQSEWMDMPVSLPPEIFNNVNTATILVLIPLMEFYLERRHKNQRVSVVSRMTIGFVLMFISMSFCAVLQLILDHRGTFVSDSSYVLNNGEESISALWLIIPFVLQGAAAVFVDTTSIEAAYTAAPTQMKSTVMAVYLLASAASGFLGLGFAPFVNAPDMSTVMLVLCGLQLFVTVLFWALSNGLDTLLCCFGSSRGSRRHNGGNNASRSVIEQLHS